MKRKGMGKVLWIGLIFLVLVGLLVAACRPAATPAPVATPTPKAKPLKIGDMGTFLYGLGPLTVDMRIGYEIAIDEITGGTGEILGRRIERVQRDTEGSPEVALRRARELVEEVGVDVIMGTQLSSVGMAVSGYAKEMKVLFMEPESQSHRLTGEAGHRYYFQFIWSSIMGARAGVPYFVDTPYRRFYIIAPDYEWGWMTTEAFKKLIPELMPDAQILGSDFAPLGEPDWRPYITKIMAAGPEVLLADIFTDDAIAFIKQAKPVGFFDRILLADPHLLLPGTPEALGMDLPEGTIAWDSYYFLAKDTPENRAFAQAYKLKTGKPRPTDRAYNGYLAMRFLLEAIKQTGGFNTEAIIDALEGMRITGPMGEVWLRSYDHIIMEPMFVGRFATSPDYDFKILTDIREIPATIAARPEEEVRAAREAGG